MSGAGSNGKEADGDALMKSAKKHLSTSIFKWSADHGSAAADYDKAGQLYARAKLVAKAREAWRLAVEQYDKEHDDLACARCHVSMSNLLEQCIEEGLSSSSSTKQQQAALVQMVEESIDLGVEAGKRYALLGQSDRQGEVLIKQVQRMQSYLPPSNQPQTRTTSSGASAKFALVRGDAKLEGRWHQRLHNVCNAAREVYVQRWQDEGAAPFPLVELERQHLLHCVHAGEMELAVETLKRLIGVAANISAEPAQQDVSVASVLHFTDYVANASPYEALKQENNAAKTCLELYVLLISWSLQQQQQQQKGVGPLPERTRAVIHQLQDSRPMQHVYGFRASAEAQAANALVAALMEGSQEALDEVLRSRREFSFITAVCSRMAMDLPRLCQLPSEEPKHGNVGGVGEVPAIATGPHNTHDDDDDDDDCDLR